MDNNQNTERTTEEQASTIQQHFAETPPLQENTRAAEIQWQQYHLIFTDYILTAEQIFDITIFI